MHRKMRGSGAFREAAHPTSAGLSGPVAIGASSSVKPGREASGGEIGSENVDMSSDKEGERPSRRKSKGFCVKLICAESAGP